MSQTTRVLLTGARGQLGRALIAALPSHLSGRAVELHAPSRVELDLADLPGLRRTVLDFRPHWVINAAAYTGVDQAEQDPDLAALVNAEAPRVIAEALAAMGQSHSCMLQISTDFVFDGNQGSPYRPDQPVAPLGVYGSSKARGEAAVLALLGSSQRAHVLRTSWVYAPWGSNFCLTMLKLLTQRAASGQPLTVVADQVGCPTSASGLAAACWRVLELREHQHLPAILHWSDAGAATWYDFAAAIAERSLELGLLQHTPDVVPIPTSLYPTPAQRPSYSLLDCTETRHCLDLYPCHWREALVGVLEQVQLAARM